MEMGQGLLGMLKFHVQVWLVIMLHFGMKDKQKVIRVKKEGVAV